MKKSLLSLFLLGLTQVSFSQVNKELVDKAVAKDNAKFVEIFKDIHENPELGFMEFRTAGIMAKELKSYGYKVIEGIAKTGVAGIIENGKGPIVMYRADMDCNAVKEKYLIME